jgi:hypothetical protein
VVEQPLKIPFAAAVIVVVNPQKPELVAEILEKSHVAIRQYLELGSWREVKLVLRFLGCLQGVLEGDGIFPVLEELFSRAVDLQTASSEDVRNIYTSLDSMLILDFIEPGVGARENNPSYDTVYHGFFCNRLRRTCSSVVGQNRYHCVNASCA